MFSSAYATHLVSPELRQITNDFGPNRMEMFDALEHLESELFEDPLARAIGLAEYMEFKLEIIDWARNRVDCRFAKLFESRVEQHINRMSISDLVFLIRYDPSVAARYTMPLREGSS